MGRSALESNPARWDATVYPYHHKTLQGIYTTSMTLQSILTTYETLQTFDTTYETL
jgi:hypothetical protein